MPSHRDVPMSRIRRFVSCNCRRNEPKRAETNGKACSNQEAILRQDCLRRPCPRLNPCACKVTTKDFPRMGTPTDGTHKPTETTRAARVDGRTMRDYASVRTGVASHPRTCRTASLFPVPSAPCLVRRPRLSSPDTHRLYRCIAWIHCKDRSQGSLASTHCIMPCHANLACIRYTGKPALHGDRGQGGCKR